MPRKVKNKIATFWVLRDDDRNRRQYIRVHLLLFELNSCFKVLFTVRYISVEPSGFVFVLQDTLIFHVINFLEKTPLVMFYVAFLWRGFINMHFSGSGCVLMRVVGSVLVKVKSGDASVLRTAASPFRVSHFVLVESLISELVLNGHSLHVVALKLILIDSLACVSHNVGVGKVIQRVVADSA